MHIRGTHTAGATISVEISS